MTMPIVALGTVLLAVLLVNPLHLWMPGMMDMLLAAAFFVLFCVWAAFVVRERAHDEREEQLRSMAGHVAFLAGAGVLALGIVAQSVVHALDPWLVFGLTAMVLAKIGVRLWGERNR